MTEDPTPQAELRIYRGHEPAPHWASDALPALRSKAAASGQQLVVLTIERTPTVQKQLAKRRHDLKAALRTFGFTLKALDSGYTFQDESAPAKREAIAKAFQVLEREMTLLGQIMTLDED